VTSKLNLKVIWNQRALKLMKTIFMYTVWQDLSKK